MEKEDTKTSASSVRVILSPSKKIFPATPSPIVSEEIMLSERETILASSTLTSPALPVEAVAAEICAWLVSVSSSVCRIISPPSPIAPSFTAVVMVLLSKAMELASGI